ncbi:RICIN domain-containing protein [Streptomyces sp. NPDC096205]|uniref:RICIN domain-containing protein n=1 Tax=Streptomyces sp. NPDC096205 TaxID=3366081 RepID=UPI00380F90F9
MAPVTSGTYVIANEADLRLTLLGGYADVRTQVVLLPPDELGMEKAQQWQVEVLDSGNVTLRNVASGTYMGYDHDSYDWEVVFGYLEPDEWQLREVTTGDGGVQLVVADGPDDGSTVAVGLHKLGVFPPLAGLRPADQDDFTQVWYLTAV